MDGRLQLAYALIALLILSAAGIAFYLWRNTWTKRTSRQMRKDVARRLDGREAEREG